MKNALRLGLCGAMLLAILTAWSAEHPSARLQAEDELIQMLGSPDLDKVKHAIDQLVDRYPKSTNAIPAIRSLLKNKSVQRRAAYALGKYHAELEMDEVKVILGFLRAYDVEEVMEALKVLRALKEPEAVAQKIVADIVPLLQDREPHVIRDACRTLAVLGNKELIPSIEPLLNHENREVKKDAQDAIRALKSRP